MKPNDSESRGMIAVLVAVCVLAFAVAAWLAWPRRSASPPTASTPAPLPPLPALQPATAQVVRVPTMNLAVINLGLGEQVRQGMLFDVYDKATGVPAATGGNPAPPTKALLELVRIGPGFSECRIIRRTPGTAIVQGDLVVQRPDPHGRTAMTSPTNP